MYSIERGRERFIIIYVYKIFKNLVPNPGISFKTDGRNGVRAEILTMKTTIPYHIRRQGYTSFNYIAPRLFNIIPLEVRNFEAPDQAKNIIFLFKNKLDEFLATIPDQPTTYKEVRAASSNSLLDQIYYQNVM